MNSIGGSSAVSVIVLCFNHARFIVESLESVRKQTFQDFDLIIMDDCSSDASVSIISDWILQSGVACTFIAHEYNVGVCKTQNEALSLCQGEYIFVVAGDDRWHPTRVEGHLKIFLQAPSDVAVLYSDAFEINEDGIQLSKTFHEGQRPGFTMPSGRVFEHLIDRNFLHPVATTLRKSAILNVGGYDERLTVEDYDMLLRLANKYKFMYVRGIYSDVRIVSNSLSRVIFVKPKASFCYGQFVLHEKWIPSGLLSNSQRKIWCENQASYAYWLYFHEDPRATRCLWTAVLRTRRPRFFALAALSTLGIRRQHARHIAAALGLVRDN